VASYSYELPWFKSAKGFQRYVLGNWQINGVTTVSGGTPISLNGPRRRQHGGGQRPSRPEI